MYLVDLLVPTTLGNIVGGVGSGHALDLRTGDRLQGKDSPVGGHSPAGLEGSGLTAKGAAYDQALHTILGE